MSEIPAQWVQGSIGDVAESMKNGVYKPADAYAEDGIACLRMYNVESGKIVWKDIKRMGLSKEDFEMYRLLPGDLLVNRVNSRELVGKAAMIPDGLEPCVFESKNIRLRLRTNLADPRFVAFKLLLDGSRHFANNAQQVVGMASISQPQLAAFPIPLPPLAEQKRIVAKIEELFCELEAGEESLRVARRQLGVYRQSLLKQAFEGHLTAKWRTQNPDKQSPASLLEKITHERQKLWLELERAKMGGKEPKGDARKKRYPSPKNPDAEPDFELPASWTWVSWDQVGLSQNGRAFPSSEYSETGIKLLRPGNLHASGDVRWTDENTRRMPARWEQEHPTFVVGGNELVMNLTAQSLADEFLGRVCLTRPDDHCLLNQRIARLRTVVINQRFALYLLKSHRFRRFVDGLNTGSLIQHMFTSQLAEFSFGLPSLPEQQEIVRLLDEQFEVIERNEREIDGALRKNEALRQAILQKAFTGRLVPQDPADEPATKLLADIRGEREATSNGPARRRVRTSA